MRKIFILTVIAFSMMLSFGNAFAGVLDERVTALEATVASQQSAIVNLQTALADLQTRLSTVENGPAVQMGTLGYLRLDTNDLNGVIGPHVIFEGVNLHLQNGAGNVGGGYIDENPPNGLGNLIIGYDGMPHLQSPLEPGDRSGSHNVVIGHGNKFAGISGMVHGWNNTVRGQYSAAIGGDSNEAGGWSAVFGGWRNIAAEEAESVVIGGYNNRANEQATVIIGGSDNIANQRSASIIGGEGNIANGYYSTITGGKSNTSTATGTWSSISGGFERQTIGEYDWAAGGLWEDQ